MKPAPTGHLEMIDGHPNLVLARTFRAPIGDVWTSVTDPGHMERWIGTWWGTPGEGRIITFLMSAEEGAEPEEVAILECDPPRRFLGDFHQSDGVWRIGLDLAETDGITTLTLTQVINPGDDTASFGPGWEYYLDRLVAARDGSAMPAWDDYYPAQKPHYEELMTGDSAS